MTPVATPGSSHYIPDYRAKTIFDIDFAFLSGEGITHAAFDVDSTITHHGSVEITPETVQFLLALKAEHALEKLCLATNRTEKNLEPLATAIDARIVQPQGLFDRKPRKNYYDRLLEVLDCPPGAAVMVGDKVRQDVYGGNRAGMTTILVDPLGPDMFWDRVLLKRLRDKLLLKVRESA